MSLLDDVAAKLEADDSGRTTRDPVYLARCRAVLAAAEDRTHSEYAEMTADLTAYFLRYQDLGRSPEAAVLDWAEEWGLADV